MKDKISFFSFNKKSDWEKGFAVNLKITDDYIKLNADIANNGMRAYFYSCAIDCTRNENIWHRLEIDGIIPSDISMKVWYYASDIKNDIYDEIVKNKRTDLQDKVECLDGIWKQWISDREDYELLNLTDALFFKAQGRYLWLRFEISGNFKDHFTIKKFRVYFPRASIIDYLPAVYQDDEESRDFLERFLSVFGTFYDEMDAQIDEVSKYLDADLAKSEYLKWLSSWLGICSDDRWSEKQLREFMKRAPEIYKRRGTKWAMEQMIEVYTGEKPCIVEYYQYKELAQRQDSSELLKELYGMDPYTFCVLIKPDNASTLREQQAIQKIIEEEKPAHANARIIILKPWIYLDTHTYLGLNTSLAEFCSMKLEPNSLVLYNNILVDAAESDDVKNK